MFLRLAFYLLITANLSFSLQAFSQGATSTPHEQIRWDLTDIYENEEAWQADYDATRVDIEELRSLKGSLGKSASALADGLTQISDVRKALYRVYVYSGLINDEDQRVEESQERLAKSRALSTQFSEAISWLEPELLEIGESKISRYIRREDDLSAFDFYLQDLLRSAPHRLDEKGEAILASAGSLVSAPNEIYELLF